MPYDNEIESLKLIVEVHGEHHYRINIHIQKEARKYGVSPEEILKKQKQRDKYKKKFAIKEGYSYLELSYKTDNVYENWKTLINNKIKEILIIRKEINFD